MVARDHTKFVTYEEVQIVLYDTFSHIVFYDNLIFAPLSTFCYFLHCTIRNGRHRDGDQLPKFMSSLVYIKLTYAIF